jgi:hypothetical protein
VLHRHVARVRLIEHERANDNDCDVEKHCGKERKQIARQGLHLHENEDATGHGEQTQNTRYGFLHTGKYSFI